MVQSVSHRTVVSFRTGESFRVVGSGNAPAEKSLAAVKSVLLHESAEAYDRLNSPGNPASLPAEATMKVYSGSIASKNWQGMKSNTMH